MTRWLYFLFIFQLVSPSQLLASKLWQGKLIPHRWLSWEEVRNGEPPRDGIDLQADPWWQPKHGERESPPLLSYWYPLPKLSPGFHQIYIPAVTQAYEAWLWSPERPFQRREIQLGLPHSDPEKQVARMLDRVLSFEVQEADEPWFLVLRVSYAGRDVGGLWAHPEVGDGEQLELRSLRKITIAFVCLGFLIFLICYQSLLYLRRPQDKAHLWIVGIAIFIALRVLGVERIACLFDLFPQSSRALALSYHFEYLSMIGLNLCFVPYLWSLYPQLKFSKTSCWIFILLSLAGFIPLSWTPYEGFAEISWIPKISVSLGLVVAGYGLFQAAKAKLPYARFLCVTSGIPLVSFAIEMLTSAGGSGGRWSHITATAFAFSLSYLMARGSAYAFDRIEELSHNLQKEVELQTQEIRAQADKDLRQAHDLLVKSEQLSQLGVLVASIGHEIASPCSAIRLSVSDGVNQVEKMREMVREIFSVDEESVAVGQLFEQNLNAIAQGLGYIHLSEGKISELSDALRRQSRSEVEATRAVDLNKLVEECLVLARGRTKQFFVDFRPVQVPPIDCVRSRIGQVVLNLVANAADALSSKRDRLRGEGKTNFEGKIKIEVTAEKEAGKAFLVVAVSDNGDGVPLDLREKIFESFFTTKPAGVGTGIGLALCVEIIREHNGELRLLDDKELGGARFEIRLSY